MGQETSTVDSNFASELFIVMPNEVQSFFKIQ